MSSQGFWRRRLNYVARLPLNSGFWLGLAYTGCGLSLLTSTFGFHRVHGRSMSPTLSPESYTMGRHDCMLFRKRLKLSTRPIEEGGDGKPGELKRGMVVVYWTPHDPNRLAVKRIVAVAGDTVLPLRKPGAMKRAGHATLDDMLNYPVTIPYGHVWVEGDNKENSRDSNSFGPISKSLIVGVASAIVLPLSRFGWFNDWDQDQSWKEKVKGRIQWHDASDAVPEEWAMHLPK